MHLELFSRAIEKNKLQHFSFLNMYYLESCASFQSHLKACDMLAVCLHSTWLCNIFSVHV